jgi:hypothetical protein
MKNVVEVVDGAIEEDGTYLLQALAELISILSVELLVLSSYNVPKRRASTTIATRRGIVFTSAWSRRARGGPTRRTNRKGGGMCALWEGWSNWLYMVAIICQCYRLTRKVQSRHLHQLKLRRLRSKKHGVVKRASTETAVDVQQLNVRSIGNLVPVVLSLSTNDYTLLVRDVRTTRVSIRTATYLIVRRAISSLRDIFVERKRVRQSTMGVS